MDKETQPKKNKKTRTLAPEQNPEERKTNFKEVSLGYSPAMAQLEASRCIQCKKPKCVIGCPVRVAIPDFIKQVAAGDFLEAARIIKESNALPGVTGRVCPQEDQCEKHCVIGIKGEPLAIGKLERFVADYEQGHRDLELIEKAPSTGKKLPSLVRVPQGWLPQVILRSGDMKLLSLKPCTNPVAFYFMASLNFDCQKKFLKLNWII